MIPNLLMSLFSWSSRFNNSLLKSSTLLCLIILNEIEKKIFANRKSNSLHGSVACDWWRHQSLHPLIASHWSRHRRSAPLRWILSSFARMTIINSCPFCNWAAVYLFSWTKLKIEDEENLWLRLWNINPLLFWLDDEQNNQSIKNAAIITRSSLAKSWSIGGIISNRQNHIKALP